MGIAKYNEECRAIVMKHSSDWRQTIDRLGRWIDFDNDYKVSQEWGSTGTVMLTDNSNI